MGRVDNDDGKLFIDNEQFSIRVRVVCDCIAQHLRERTWTTFTDSSLQQDAEPPLHASTSTSYGSTRHPRNQVLRHRLPQHKDILADFTFNETISIPEPTCRGGVGRNFMRGDD